MNPSFCSLTEAKQSLQYTRKTDLIGPPMPKFEANMNYIPQSPPRSMKQCNKSATVKFHMELLLTTTSQKQSHSGTTPYRALVFHKHSFFFCIIQGPCNACGQTYSCYSTYELLLQDGSNIMPCKYQALAHGAKVNILELDGCQGLCYRNKTVKYTVKPVLDTTCCKRPLF